MIQFLVKFELIEEPWDEGNSFTENVHVYMICRLIPY